MPPLRIAMFSDYYPPHVGGGVEKVVAELASGLASEGHEVEVFTLNTDGGAGLEEAGGLRIHRSPCLDLTRIFRLQSAVSPRMLSQAFRALRRNPPDVIHAHNTFFFSSLVAAALSKVLRVPLVTTLHLGNLDALPPPQRLPVAAYERTLGSMIVQASNRLIAVSQAVAAHALRHGASVEKLTVQPNAVDCSTFHPRAGHRQGPFRAAFVGRLIQNKGPQFLVEAIPALLSTAPDAHVWFIGDGPMLSQLQARVRELGVEDGVEFLGTRTDVDGLLREVDAFVRPSLMEGLPLTVLEAMASGLPVVATPVGGTPEVVADGVNGLLVPVHDVTALSDALVRLAGDGFLRRRMGEEGRRQVEQDYGWQRITRETISVYESLLPQRCGSTLARPELSETAS